MKPLGKSATRT